MPSLDENSEDTGELRQPRAIQPLYSTPKPNAEIILYDDLLEVQTDRGISSRPGQLIYVWQPRAALRVAAKLDFNVALMPWDEFKASFRLPNVGQFTEITVEVAGTESATHEPSFGYLQGSSAGVIRAATAAMNRIVFHVPNFTSFAGSMVWNECEGALEGNHGRATIQHPDWRILLDTTQGFNYFRERDMQRGSGNGITHVGQITRPDNSDFTTAEAIKVLQQLSLWLSFTRGNWTAPILSCGFTSDGSRVWEDWRSQRIEPPLPVSVGADPNRVECFELSFAGFCQRCSAPGWSEPTALAINWYVECCRETSGLEAAIILSQNGLELLGWSYLVDDKRCCSAKTFDGFDGPKKIRKLILQCGIPMEIPSQLRSLRSFADEEGMVRWSGVPSLHSKRSHPFQES